MAIIKDILLWIYWHPFKFFIQKLPPKYVYRLTRVLASLFFHAARNKKRDIEREFHVIEKAIPKEIDINTAIKNAFFIRLSNEIEVMLFPTLNKENIDYFVTCIGLEHLDAAIGKGKGAMLLFAHFGANQMIMPAVGYRGYTMSQMSAPPTVWTEKLPNKKISRMGFKALEVRWAQELSLPVTHINIFGSLKDAFVCLKRNEILGIAIDGGGGKTKVVVDFLGRRAYFSTGAIEIAMRTGCAVLPTFMLRGEDGRHTMIIEPPLNIATDVDDPVEVNTSAFIKRLEEYIYKYPCHYLNFLALRAFMERQRDSSFFVKEDDNENTVSQAAVS